MKDWIPVTIFHSKKLKSVQMLVPSLETSAYNCFYIEVQQACNHKDPEGYGQKSVQQILINVGGTSVTETRFFCWEIMGMVNLRNKTKFMWQCFYLKRPSS